VQIIATSLEIMKRIFLSIFCFSALFASAQEIKTRVQESEFNVKPDPTKEEQYEEARVFIFADAGLGIRNGNFTTGFLPPGQSDLSLQTTEVGKPFKNGFLLSFGFMYYFQNNLGLGIRGNWFYNYGEFFTKTGEKANATTTIYGFMPEVSYRKYLSSDKEGFIYGGIGAGINYQLQSQYYSKVQKYTDVNQGFFAARPFLGINLPVYEIIHLHAETGYQFSEGSIPSGVLSLSQFQLSAGVSIRLNSF
jgi:hypothetical protein